MDACDVAQLGALLSRARGELVQGFLLLRVLLCQLPLEPLEQCALLGLQLLQLLIEELRLLGLLITLPPQLVVELLCLLKLPITLRLEPHNLRCKLLLHRLELLPLRVVPVAQLIDVHGGLHALWAQRDDERSLDGRRETPLLLRRRAPPSSQGHSRHQG